MPFMIWGRTPLNSLRLEGNFPKVIQVLYRNYFSANSTEKTKVCSPFKMSTLRMPSWPSPNSGKAKEM